MTSAPARPAVGLRDWVVIGVAAAAAIAAGVATFAGVASTVTFIIAAIALAAMASVVGRSVEGLAGRLGPTATGIVQSMLGNLPELFVTLFALKAGLVTVVQATIVGSILANVLLVLGAAFIVGGVKHGVQKFAVAEVQAIGVLLLLAVSVLAIPSLTAALHTPAEGHERELSVFAAVIMLVVFGLSLLSALRASSSKESAEVSAKFLEPGAVRTSAASTAVSDTAGHGGWPFGFAVAMLAITGVAAACVSDWFVAALDPTMASLGISEAFAGLVIVAIAGNAVENIVGVQLAARNQSDYAVQVILQSPLQIALFVAPVLVLAAPLVGAATFTLVLPPLLLVALLLAVVIVLFVVFDGTSAWIEGVVLVGLYAIIAASFWWG